MKQSDCEFLKLEEIDRQLAFWMIEHHPESVSYLINDYEANYYAKGIMLNTVKIISEIKKEYPFLKKDDLLPRLKI